MSEQLSLTFHDEVDCDVERLIRDMWRCIQVSPLAPPALKESIRQRLVARGLGADEMRRLELPANAPTERLIRLLRERGVECAYTKGDHGMVTWRVGPFGFSAANAWPRNDETRTRLVLHVTYPTPEEAIEITLGLSGASWRVSTKECYGMERKAEDER